MPLSGPMSSLSPEQGLEAMLRRLSEASPVNPSRSLAKSLALATNVTCSEMSSESLMNLDRNFSFWKTRQACLFPIQTDETNLHQYQTFLGSWPKAALIVRGSLYPQKMWEVRTVESAGGRSAGAKLWPTATVDGLNNAVGSSATSQDGLSTAVKRWHTPHGQANVDHTGKIGGGGELDMQIRQWATPREADRGQKNSSDNHAAVSFQVKQWATPQAHDVHQGDPERVGRFGTAHGGRNLTDDVQFWQTPSSENFRSRGGNRIDEMGLDNQVKNWSTPAVDDANQVTRDSGIFKSLTRDVRAWGTPRAQDCKGTGPKGTGPKGTVSQLHRLKKGYLDAQVEEIADGGRKDESLNPDWEETLMGWEIGWTDPTKPCDAFPGWPMGQGYEQYDYEPPRTLPRKLMSGRTARIKMIGNGIVPQAATMAYVKLLRLLLRMP
jgi:hypothetical protein